MKYHEVRDQIAQQLEGNAHRLWEGMGESERNEYVDAVFAAVDAGESGDGPYTEFDVEVVRQAAIIEAAVDAQIRALEMDA